MCVNMNYMPASESNISKHSKAKTERQDTKFTKYLKTWGDLSEVRCSRARHEHVRLSHQQSETRLLFIVTLKMTEVRGNMSFSLRVFLCCCCCLVRSFGTSYAVLSFLNQTKKQKVY